MFVLWSVRKVSVLILIGVFLVASIMPIMNGTQIKISDTKSVIFGSDIATKVVQAKLHELNKTDFSIAESTKIINEQEETLFYVYNLSPLLCCSF